MSKHITKKARYCHANLRGSALQNINDNTEIIKKKDSLKQNYILKSIGICRQDISLILSSYSIGKNNLD